MLKQLASQLPEERYRIRPHTENGKSRWVQVPRSVLKHVHRRIFCLLNQIITPDYLHSGKRGRSYITNAQTHVGAKAVFTIDVSRFFESVLWKDVYNFFCFAMKCAPHVSATLADLCTVERREMPFNDPAKRDRHLPTGSPISQCLAYWCFAPMFDAIFRLAKSRGLAMTVYVDDITISGDKISKATQQDIKEIIARFGLVGHKARLYGSTAFVTGTIVTLLCLRLPNSRRQQVLAGVCRLKQCRQLKYRVAHLRRLVGQLWSAVELDAGLKKQATDYQNHLNTLYQENPQYKPRSRKRKRSVFGLAESREPRDPSAGNRSVPGRPAH